MRQRRTDQDRPLQPPLGNLRPAHRVEPTDSDTPCSTTGPTARAHSRTASGRLPRIMKFSEIASSQSTRAVPSKTRAKCFIRRPTPWPR
jgi:hypothetical protein